MRRFTIRAPVGRVELWLVLALEIATPVAPFAHVISLEFRDAGGQPLPVRAGLFSGSQVHPPVDPASHMYQSRGLRSYFYCDGFAEVDAPAGPLTIRAGCGFEYQPRDTTVNVSGPATITMTLTRFVDTKADGWYSGDTHVHITHQPQIYTLDAEHLLLAVQGEDINYANSMEEQAAFTGLIDPLSRPDRILHFSKEERNAHFSHLSILGLRQWIPDTGCVEPNVLCGRTLDVAIHNVVHAQAGEQAVIATHPFVTSDMYDVSGWPGGGMWRAMAIDLVAGAVDAMDLLTYPNLLPPGSSHPYFHALNAGFRLPPAAGTDCILATTTSPPLGGYRMYVNTDGPFTMDSWIAGLKAGRSFVTNYPLFAHFDVEGKEPGQTLYTLDQTLHGSVWVKCIAPVTKIEIIGNTGVLAVLQPPSPRKSFASTFAVPGKGISWIVARATGPASSWHLIDAAGLFAQTAPVYIANSSFAMDGSDLLAATGEPRVTAAMYFLGRLSMLEDAYNTLGYFPDGSRAAFDSAVAQARAYYTSLLTVSGVSPPALRAHWEITNISPNPAERRTRVTYRAPTHGTHRVDVYDAAGRLVRGLYQGARPPGDYELEWDGVDARGSRVASGVYFVRIRPEAAAPAARKLVLIR